MRYVGARKGRPYAERPLTMQKSPPRGGPFSLRARTCYQPQPQRGPKPIEKPGEYPYE